MTTTSMFGTPNNGVLHRSTSPYGLFDAHTVQGIHVKNIARTTAAAGHTRGTEEKCPEKVTRFLALRMGYYSGSVVLLLLRTLKEGKHELIPSCIFNFVYANSGPSVRFLFRHAWSAVLFSLGVVFVTMSSMSNTVDFTNNGCFLTNNDQGRLEWGTRPHGHNKSVVVPL